MLPLSAPVSSGALSTGSAAALRRFVVKVLRVESRVCEERATTVMSTAHQRGACIIAVFTKDVAEAKVTSAIDLARKNGFPLVFTSEPEG